MKKTRHHPAYQGKRDTVQWPKNYKPLPPRDDERFFEPDAPHVRARAMSRWELMKATEFNRGDPLAGPLAPPLKTEAQLIEEATARLATPQEWPPLSNALRGKLGLHVDEGRPWHTDDPVEGDHFFGGAKV